MNRLQIRQFVIRNIDGNGEEQACILSPVNEFVGIVFNEVGILLVMGSHKLMNFGLNASLFSSNNGTIFFCKQWVFLIIS
jgi:hypothetical protein